MDEYFGFKHSMILLVSEDKKCLNVLETYGYENKGIGAKVNFGIGVIGIVAQKKKLMRMANLGIYTIPGQTENMLLKVKTYDNTIKCEDSPSYMKKTNFLALVKEEKLSLLNSELNLENKILKFKHSHKMEKDKFIGEIIFFLWAH